VAVIEVSNLRKAYGNLMAVDGVTWSVAEQEVVAILGPNGAGKTTTVEIVEGYRRRDSGQVSVLGLDPDTGGRGGGGRQHGGGGGGAPAGPGPGPP